MTRNKKPDADSSSSTSKTDAEITFERDLETLTSWTSKNETKLREEIAEMVEEWRNVAFVTQDGELVPRDVSSAMAVLTATLGAEEFWRKDRFQGMNDKDTKGT